ncbi:MBOAT, membrane-bound O-acyltransferase family-domain-containing protein [Absidia repens]|uniref:Lysophospholipid acyltransferase 5 n=1 Tax=Absidia repens TaxID=90262 RepID=A0A1X2IMJ8_9FUNG|nr:MBOAT, membrane-bound O-acyltransferase family-domain-containing protein [Absidia repens]
MDSNHRLLTYPISYLVYTLKGTHNSTAILLLTTSLTYVPAYWYNHYYSKHRQVKATLPTSDDLNAFIVYSGLALSLCSNGLWVFASLFLVALTYAMCYLFGESPQHRATAGYLAWIVHGVYLLRVYYSSTYNNYDIAWTMPQCMVCLRLMGLTFDYMNTDDDTTSISQRPKPMVDTRLYTLPSISQWFGYCFFPAPFLVGPQFSFNLYHRWIKNPPFSGIDVTDWDEAYKGQWRYLIRCVLLAAAFFSLQQVFGAAYEPSHLLSKEYQQFSFLHRSLVLLITGKFIYNKYIGIWLLSEGAYVLYGVTYGGEDADGHPLFGCFTNVQPWKYLTAITINDVIESFNININVWVDYYVFKQSRWFIQNEAICQSLSLMLLTVWRGCLHLNDVITFFLIFYYTRCETAIKRRLSSITVCPYVWTAYKSVYFIGHLMIPLILVLDRLIPRKHVPIKNRNQKIA